NVENQVSQNPRVQNVGNQNGLIGVQGNGNQNQIGNGNLVAVRAEENAAGYNGNHIRCYNCRGIGHFARDCTVRLRRRDAAYLQTQLLISHKEEAGIQLQAKEYDLMAVVADLDEIEEKIALGYQNPFYLKQGQKKQQSLYDGKVLLLKHDPPVVHDSEETLQLAQESREKMKQMNKEIKPANYTKINHLSRIFVLHTALSREELYFSNISKMANVSKSISIPNEDLSDDTTPSVACKFLNEEADASLAKHKILELEIKRLLKAFVSQDIISVVQNASVVDTSDFQTELERIKERFENSIIKKENEYAKL
nr:hypothetical protein [Tanacetum cinerariifolium]GFB21694.1 hypothetical protein [Tanacetum cinerariifolium]